MRISASWFFALYSDSSQMRPVMPSCLFNEPFCGHMDFTDWTCDFLWREKQVIQTRGASRVPSKVTFGFGVLATVTERRPLTRSAKKIIKLSFLCLMPLVCGPGCIHRRSDSWTRAVVQCFTADMRRVPNTRTLQHGNLCLLAHKSSWQ